MRFLPDTWLEFVLRPVAMTAPDANVYVEIMAPDLRFVFVLALLAAWPLLVLLRRRRADPGTAGTGAGSGRTPVLVLLVGLALAFVPWLAIVGNGRYFLPGLLIVGPVCVGLVRLLPVTRAMRLALAIAMVALQAFVVQQSAPWRAWTLASWKEAPYFQVDIPADVRAQPATYVTMSAISYSLVAPLFHPDSRWINLHNAPAPDSGALVAPRTAAFLAQAEAGPMRLFVPAVAGRLTPQRLPDARVSQAMGEQLAPYRLAFRQPQSCRFLPSGGLAGIGLGEKDAQQLAQSGFWLCELERLPAGAAPKGGRGHRFDAVFRALETQCPRMFPPGGDGASLSLPAGEVRSYHQAEMKAYVYDSGEVYYKYYRVLNPVLVGRADDLVAGRSRLDCNRIRGRAGLPWEREI